MADYEKMFNVLFHAVDDALCILRTAMYEAEDIYCDTDDNDEVFPDDEEKTSSPVKNSLNIIPFNKK